MFAERFARYWMNTCVDAEKMNVDIGNKKYYRPDSGETPQLEKCFFHVPYDALKSGTLPEEITSVIFNCLPDNPSPAGQEGKDAGEEPEERTCIVLVCPVYFSAVSEHGKQQGGDNKGMVQRITPVWIPAILREKDGALLTGEEGSPWIPREYLEPVDTFGRTVVIGTVKDLDEYVTRARGSVDLETWRDTFRYAVGMVEHVINAGSQSGERKRLADLVIEGYEVISFDDLDERAGIVLPLVGKDKRIVNTTRHIEELFGSMLQAKKFPPLFRSLVSYEVPELQASAVALDRSAASPLHVGQMGGKYPLVDSQREALHHVLLMKGGPDDNLVAVNGPPGTGKTTLIQSIVASLWVRAAIDGKEPPLIFGTSANNRPVKNIIECFEKTEPPDHGADWVSLLKGRWLPGVGSYGAFCGRKADQSGAGELDGGEYQLVLRSNDSKDGFFDELLTEERLSDLRNEYLAAGGRYISWRQGSTASRQPGAVTVSGVVEALHKEIINIDKKQRNMLDLLHEEKQINEVFTAVGGENIKKYKESLLTNIDTAEDLSRKIQEAKSKFIASTKPFWLILGARIGFAKIEMAKRNFHICSQLPFDITSWLPSTTLADDKAIMCGYDDALEQARTSLDKWTEAHKKIESLERRLSSCEREESDLAGDLGIIEDGGPRIDLDNVDSLLDTVTRYRLFLLATHYWEGKWLIEASELLDEKGKSGRDDVFPRREQWSLKQWRNYAKLTPCFIATAFTLPKYLRHWGEPLYEGIDYLIIDEAGQVSPEVVAGCFALAKKAIVVGDTRQIEPVWRVTSPVDEGNILKHGLHQDLPETIKDPAPARSRGLTSYEGNILKAVQGRINYSSTGDETQRGVMLREHFRCVPEVINYCNELAYKGQLIPSRKGIDAYILPHLGYAHVRGVCQKRNGSRCNEEEAECIVEWIKDNIDRLKKYYMEKEKKDIDEADLVAVVTPFAPQARLIASLLKQAGRGSLTAGTTHALQGAERKVVIFSPVYDGDHPGNYFFDTGVNMLNVAVSRAKDSFLVFGDMNIFRRKSGNILPSKLLGHYLFNSSNNEITNTHVPQKRIREKPLYVLDTVQKHVEALRRAIQEARERVIIYSPWLSIRAVEKDRLDTVIRAKLVADPGVKVTIYTDKDNNSAPGKINNYRRGRECVEAAGAEVVELEKIHQKIVVMDNSRYMVGSFNWLSSWRATNPGEIGYQENRTMVYSGPEVGKMIEDELKYISSREKEFRV